MEGRKKQREEKEGKRRKREEGRKGGREGEGKEGRNEGREQNGPDWKKGRKEGLESVKGMGKRRKGKKSIQKEEKGLSIISFMPGYVKDISGVMPVTLSIIHVLCLFYDLPQHIE